jgi:hypothetical protein
LQWTVESHRKPLRAVGSRPAKYQGAVGSRCKTPRDGRISPQIPTDSQISSQNTKGRLDFTVKYESQQKKKII